jgi:hypothetical protein
MIALSGVPEFGWGLGGSNRGRPRMRPPQYWASAIEVRARGDRPITVTVERVSRGADATKSRSTTPGSRSARSTHVATTPPGH